MDSSSSVQDGYGLLLPLSCAAGAEGKLAWDRSYPETLRCYYRAVESIAAVRSKGCCGFGGFKTGVESLGSASFDSNARRLIGGADKGGNRVFLQSSSDGSGSGGVVGNERVVCGGDDKQSCCSKEFHVGGCCVISGTRQSTCESVVDSFVASDNGVFGCVRDVNLIDSSEKGENESQSENSKLEGSVVGLGVPESGLSKSKKKKEKIRRYNGNKRAKQSSLVPEWRRNASSNKVGLGGSVGQQGSTLRSSLEKKWELENELAAERARRQLEVLKANDIDQEVKRYRTKVSAATEKNMVSIEKTHAMLSATGNIPGVFHGSAETVVSGEPGLTDGSISPNSSASMAEFRACQKNLLDSQKSLLDSQNENADLKRKMQLMSERFGFPMQHADYIDKRTWTDNEENDLILGDMYPDGYGMNTMFMPEGKFRPC